MKGTAKAARRNKRLGALLGALCALYGLSFFRPAQAGIRQGVLLNSPADSPVRAVLLTSPAGESLRLSWQKSLWVGEKEGLIFPVREDYARGFLENAARPRPLISLTESEKTLGAYALTENSAFRVEFFDAGGNTLSSLMFGNPDYTGRLIAVRSVFNHTAYYVEDDFSSSLTVDPRFWLDGGLIPQSLAPDSGAVQGVTLSLPPDSPGTERTILRAPQSAYTPLLGLRSSRIVPPEEAEARRAGEAAILGLESADGGILSLRIFPLSPATGEYACVPAFVPGVRAGPEDLRYALIISAWTYERLLGLFQDRPP